MGERGTTRYDPAVDRRIVLAGTAVTLTGLAGCIGGGGGQEVTVTGPTLDPPVMGDPEADVTVAAYEDYACQHCKDYNETVVPTLVSEYVEPGTIRYEHHDFPIPVDPEVSWQAASAARAVQDRAGDEAFWTYSKALFEHQSELGPEMYANLAGEADVPGEEVRTAAVDEAYRPTVQKDRNRGQDAGVSATPTVLVNGEAVDRPTVDAIGAAIENA
ncbi:disulfide bond formation protein DsbA [Halobacteriales archaeon QS_1_68_17]|nr:MAG: disulfide bond formation protein DsbA [Halobacteriales archaeon QS_1_68_17]